MLVDVLLILGAIFATILIFILGAILLPAIGIFLIALFATIAAAPYAMLDWILSKTSGEK